MKRTLIILILCAVLLPWAEAQTDTVPWKYSNYHYSVWYDTLPEFFSTQDGMGYTPALFLFPWYCNSIGHVTAYPQHVDRPTLVQGVAVTERLNYNSDLSIIQHHQYTEEYVYLFQKVGDTVELLDSVRWDTITPKVMKIALNADTGKFGFSLIKVYEAMFSEPIMVDSVFYTLSSNNGGNAYCGSMYYEFVYYPAEPMVVYANRMGSDPAWCPKPSWFVLKQWALYRGRQWVDFHSACNSPFFGMYFPIVDYVNLIVTSADTTMGTAGPDIRVSRNMWQSIHAEPKPGYKFSHWQEDSCTLATQSVYITQDTTHYTAVFEPITKKYRLDVRSNDERMGYVTGDSTYYEGDTATIEAFASYGYVFDRWSTGDTANPLLLAVESDTVITAYFSARQLGTESSGGERASFTLTPNPAHHTVTVRTSVYSSNATLTLLDAAGRKSLSIPITTPSLTIPLHDLPAGTYLVTLTTTEGSSTQRLVVQ